MDTIIRELAIILYSTSSTVVGTDQLRLLARGGSSDSLLLHAWTAIYMAYRIGILTRDPYSAYASSDSRSESIDAKFWALIFGGRQLRSFD